MTASPLPLIHLVARATVGFVWIYHGIVPKLLYRHADELALMHDGGVSVESAPTVIQAIGAAEVVVGLLIWLGFPSLRWLFRLTIVFGVCTTIGVAIQSPRFLIAAFNPVSLNVQIIALAWIGLLSSPDSPAHAPDAAKLSEKGS